MNPARKTYFNDNWLRNLSYKSWIQRGPSSEEGRCKMCKSTFKLGNMGEQALKSHANGKIHKKFVLESEKVISFFKPKTKAAVTDSSPQEGESSGSKTTTVDVTSSGISQDTITRTFQTNEVLIAEIRWTLKHVVSGYSDNSCDGTVKLFTTMFPDSKIAQRMQLQPNKIKYNTNHGLAPHFKDILKENINRSNFVSVLFDESLNDFTQDCEMDLIVRYWNECKNIVEDRYWDSMFFGHSTNIDIFEHFNQGLSGVDLSKLVQVSMDGPNVNLKFLRKVDADRKETNLCDLIDIGTCNLHTVHNAFKRGAESTDWKLKELMRGCFQLLHDSPARREDFVSITGAKKFPMHFCATRYFSF